MGDYAISEELKQAYDDVGIKNYQLDFATSGDFYNALKAAKSENDYGAFVELRSEPEYANMVLLLTEDKKAGVAITEDKNIISVFKGDSSMENVISTLLPAAIELGGNKLDNFNSEKLSLLYMLYGFIPVSKTQFNSEFAPNDWNYDRDGQPDIIFWVHNGASAAEIVKGFGDIDLYNYDVDIKEFSTYDQAENYRDNIIRLSQSPLL